MADEILPVPVTTRSRSDPSGNSRAASSQSTTSLPIRESLEVASDVPSAAQAWPSTSIHEKLPYGRPFSSNSYLKRVEVMATDTPALRGLNISDEDYYSEHDIDVIVLDIQENWTCLKHEFYNEERKDEFGRTLPETGDVFTNLKEHLGKVKHPDTIARLILVQGLSLAMVEALGSTLDLEPNFFAEHLNPESDCRLRIHRRRPWTDIETPRKSISLQEKPGRFFSIRWKRTYLQDPPSNARYTGLDFNQLPEKARIRIRRSMHGAGLRFSRYDVFLKKNVEVTAAEEWLTCMEKEDDCGLTGVILFLPELPSSDRGGRGGLCRTRGLDLDTLNRRTIYSSIRLIDLMETDKYSSRVIPEDTSTTRSQFLNFVARLKSQPRDAIRKRRDFNLSTALFQFILSDWQDVLAEMDNFLDSVDEQLSDNQALQTEIIDWRTALGSYRINLVKYRDVVTEIQEVIRERKLWKLEKYYNDLLQHVARLMERTEKTFSALMSSMSIVESQRAIQQAESVTRLTELAFFFIPLSFATSLFGMDIPSWSENYRPYMFVVAAISLLCGAYGFRLIVRSRILGEGRNRIVKSVRNANYLSAGENIPTTSYLRWLARRSVGWLEYLLEVWYWITCLLSCVAGMTLVLVWSKNATIGVKIGISAMVSIVMFMWLIIVVMKVGYWDPYDAKDLVMFPMLMILFLVASPVAVLGHVFKIKWIKDYFEF